MQKNLNLGDSAQKLIDGALSVLGSLQSQSGKSTRRGAESFLRSMTNFIGN